MGLFERDEIELVHHKVEMDFVDEIIPKFEVDCQLQDDMKTFVPVKTEKLLGYKIKTRDGEVNELESLGANPHRLMTIDGEPVTTTSHLYTPVQHKDLFEAIENMLLPNFPDMEASYCHGRNSYQVFGSYKLKDMKVPWDKEGGGKYDVYLVATNSIDTSLGIRTGITFNRLFCANQLVGHTIEAGSYIKHVQAERNPQFVINRVLEKIAILVDSMIQMPKEWERWTKITLEDENVLRVAKKLNLTKKEAEGLVQHGFNLEHKEGSFVEAKLDGKKTKWDLFQAITNMAGRQTNIERQNDLQNRVPDLIQWS